MPGLAAVGPTLVVAGAVDAALPATAAAAAAVFGAVVVVLKAVALGDVVAGVGTPIGVLGGVVVPGAGLAVLATGTRSRQCSCSRPP